MAKKIDLEIKLDVVAQKLQQMSQQVQQIHVAALHSVNCLSTFAQAAAPFIYQCRLDDLADLTHLDRDMLHRWCEELASTNPDFTPITAAERLYALWLMSPEQMKSAEFQWILSSKGI